MAALERLDHAVFNVGVEMDRAEPAFRRLGFTLTARGHHSLGSINHLMMFETDYLELIGLPPGRAHDRPDISGAPIGLNGLVFKTADVDATYAHFQALGMAGDPPKAFTRPVRLADGERTASFRTVHVRADVFPGGRVYFCEHATPELVWRPEWQEHANGARAVAEFVVVSTAAEAQAAAFARLLNTEVAGAREAAAIAYQGGRVSVLSPEAYRARYGALALAMDGRETIFGAVVLRTGGLDAVRGVLAGLDPPLAAIDETARVALREPGFASLIEFV